MLAAFALLLLPSKSPVPNAFMSTELKPILPIQALANLPRHSVTRGSSWKKGGLVRLNFYYRFGKDEGPTLEDFLAEKGFTKQEFGFGPSPGVRAVRDGNNLRQVVGVTTLEAGTYWKWANLSGPAKLVTVSEFPISDALPVGWHKSEELEKPPLPPTYPPPFEFAKLAEVTGVVSESLIPRNFRTLFWSQVATLIPGDRQAVIALIRREATDSQWTLRETKSSFRLEKKDEKVGLLAIDLGPTLEAGTKKARTEVRFNYSFNDPSNLPRIVD